MILRYRDSLSPESYTYNVDEIHVFIICLWLKVTIRACKYHQVFMSNVLGSNWVGGGGGGGRRCYRRPQNKQIYMPQNTDFNKTMPKAADLIFSGALDL